MPILGRTLKSRLRPFIPARLRHAVLNRQALHSRYRTGSLEEMFGAIYRDGIWGSADDFMSGSGSHDARIVQPYVAAVRGFAERSDPPLTAVDLGCGDFAVGRQLVSAFAHYHACDVVPALIARNRAKFADPRVTFAQVDMVEDKLPDGDVVMVRQVLQHLSNAQIAQVLPKLNRFRYLIVTEHVPASTFTPNFDKAAGPHTRLAQGSGVVLDRAPFDLRREKQVLARVEEGAAVIETTLWT